MPANRTSITVTFIIKSLPKSTPPDAAIYIAGDFNDWYPDSEQFRLKKHFNNMYSISFTSKRRAFEYKFTRGSWETAECGKYRHKRFPNRMFIYDRDNIIYVDIVNWEDKLHTATNQVKLLSENFYMPQLKRKRRIWIYLPPDYDTTTKRYPIIYMHDGQNLFDDFYAFNGEWGIDKTLNYLHDMEQQTAIVVGIENGGELRATEYLPRTRHPKYKGGEAPQYAEFIVKTLKPFVDKNYRTLPDRENTATIGSSFGGIISFYAGMKYQSVFSKLGVFSPSFPIVQSLYDWVQNTGKQHPMRIYFLLGLREGGISRMMQNLDRMNTVLSILGFTEEELKTKISPDGEHKEWFWRREFSLAFNWLFQ